MSDVYSQRLRLHVHSGNPLARLSELVTTAVRAVAFWLSVLFPLTYLPLLGDGIAGSELALFLALLAGHGLALTLGHEHAR